VSSLWTPGGEHRVPDDPAEPAREAVDAAQAAADEAEADDVEAALRAEIEDARRRLAEVPAGQVVANHAMGLFELAAIHLSQSPPRRDEASIAIDAMAAILDAVGPRLEPNAAVLRDALSQIRLAFVNTTP
jgi:hypothetical protein